MTRAPIAAALAALWLCGLAFAWEGGADEASGRPDAPVPETPRLKAPPGRRIVVPPAVATIEETFLGVLTEPVPELLAVHLKDHLQKGQGLVVLRVVQGSPADKAGLKRYDILTTFDDQKLVNAAQLKALVTAEKAESRVTLGVIREGKPLTVEVTLGKHAVVAPVPFGPPPAFAPGPGGVLIPIQPPGSFRRAPAEHGSKRPPTPRKAAQPRLRVMTLQSHDGKTYELGVRFTDADGKEQQRSFRGSLEEIRKHLSELPEPVADAVREYLEQATAEGKTAQHLKVRVRPQLDPSQPRRAWLLLSVVGPVSDRGIRAIEIREPLPSGDAAKTLEAVFSSDTARRELSRLPRVWQQQLIGALRDTPTPRIKFDIQQPQ